MAATPELTGLALLEYDTNGDTIWAWKYPSIEQKLEEVIKRKCNIEEQSANGGSPFIYGKYSQYWFYCTSTVVEGNAKLPKVLKASAVIIAKDFNPERYNALGSVLLKTYLLTGTPVSVLELYLAVFTRGRCESEDGSTFEAEHYPKEKALMKTCLKEIVPLFGIEAIIIYTALLLQRKVVVLANKLDVLLNVCRSLPALIWHRQDWNLMYPHVELNADELNDIKSRKSYILGCLDQAVESKTDLYDVLVNVSEGEISINPKSKAYFQMGKLHKDIALFLVESTGDENASESEIIEGLHRRTKDIIANLKSLSTEDENSDGSFITLKMLQSRNLSPAMQTFLYNLALAEGLLRRHKTE